MTTFSLNMGRGRRARLWIDEPPILPEAPPGTSLTIDLAADPRRPAGRRVCLEIAIPRGARLLYGLLCGEHITHDGPKLSVVVPVSVEIGHVVPNSLSNPIESAYSGLLPEYGEAVIAAIASIEPTFSGSPGILHFRAAHSVSGSAPIVFAKLANLVLEFMFVAANQLEESLLTQRISASVDY